MSWSWSGEHLAIELPGARAVFTTRRGGVSSGPYAELNLGPWTDDDPAGVRENRRRVAAELGVRLAQGRQVHGTVVRRVEAFGEGGGDDRDAEDYPGAAGGDDWDLLPEADGQATASPGIAPTVLVADCLPVALAGPTAVAMLHCGWRGLAEGVVRRGAEALREAPRAAAIGPGARACCYEVGEEVHAAFTHHGAHVRRGRRLDLAEVARRELAAVGVAIVHDAEVCTICGDASRWFSHRRDGGITGRQAGIAWRA